MEKLYRAINQRERWVVWRTCIRIFPTDKGDEDGWGCDGKFRTRDQRQDTGMWDIGKKRMKRNRMERKTTRSSCRSLRRLAVRYYSICTKSAYSNGIQQWPSGTDPPLLLSLSFSRSLSHSMRRIFFVVPRESSRTTNSQSSLPSHEETSIRNSWYTRQLSTTGTYYIYKYSLEFIIYNAVYNSLKYRLMKLSRTRMRLEITIRLFVPWLNAI